MGRNDFEDTTAQTESSSKLNHGGGVGGQQCHRYSMFHIKQLRGAEENPAEILRVMSLEQSQPSRWIPFPYHCQLSQWASEASALYVDK